MLFNVRSRIAAHHKLFWLVAGVLAVVFVCLHFINFTNHQIRFDGQKFIPEYLEVKVGDRVVFINESDKEFWPASNLHPSHSIYSEFDPKQPVAMGQSWSFVFTKVGDWEFHDHLTPTAKGQISVLRNSDTENTVSNCQDNITCWQEQIVSTLKKDGAEEAFAVFSQLYANEDRFRVVCHDMAHLIGEEAYSEFAKGADFSLTNATSYCGYGFYHGFMETLLVTTGDMAAARNFCDYVDEQLQAYGSAATQACYHGVGHGFTDGSDPRAWGDPGRVTATALRMCEEIATNYKDKYLCGTGVYNGLAIAFDEGLYDLSVTPETVFSTCAEVVDKDFKLACYEQMNTLAVSEAQYHAGTLFKMISEIEDKEYVGLTLQSAVGVLAHANRSDVGLLENLLSECLTVFESEQVMCLSGVVGGLIEFGTPGREHIEAADLCQLDSLNSVQQTQCFQSVVGFARTSKGELVAREVCDLYSDQTGETLSNCR